MGGGCYDGAQLPGGIVGEDDGDKRTPRVERKNGGDENAEHLALGDFIMPLGMRLNIGKNVVYVRGKV